MCACGRVYIRYRLRLRDADDAFFRANVLDQLLPTRYSLSGVAAAASSSSARSSSPGKSGGRTPKGIVLDPSGAVGTAGGAAAIARSVDKSALSAALSTALGEGYEGPALAALRDEGAAAQGAPLENEAHW